MTFFAILLAAWLAWAQDASVPALKGRVLDAAGAPVSGAELSLKASGTGRALLSLSGANGAYHFDKLEPGVDYEVRAYREGLASGTRTLRISSDDERITLNLTIAPRIQFEETALRAGMDFTLRNGAEGHSYQPEIMGGGVAAFDFNNDGCMDIFFVNGAALPSGEKTGPEFQNKLLRNNCDGTFTDVTTGSGLGGKGYGMGVGAGDFDNDGLPDLLVTGLRGNHLYRNKGEGKFEDVTARAGLGGVDPPWTISAGWFDYDNDGFLDVFVTSYVAWEPGLDHCSAAGKPFYCHPRVYKPLPNHLFHNNGNGTFTDVSEASGIRKSLGKGMGLAFGDYDGDGLMDVFVANDSAPNFLFRNLGGGKFREVAVAAGVAYQANGNAIAGMGADFRDVDNDGRDDIVLNGMYFDTFPFFRNRGKPAFFGDETIASGLAKATRNATGWGMGIYDFDNDGAKDLFFAASHFPGSEGYVNAPAEAPNMVLLNTGSGTFEDVSRFAGADFQSAALHHGVAFADFENDGRVDAVVTAIGSRARLFRNVSGKQEHWIGLRLQGTKSNRDGLGAQVRLTLPNGRMQYNRATTSVGYASSSEPLVRFGLGPYSNVREIQIRWPSGTVQTLADIAVDRVHRVSEP